jgi:penicillin amidase
MAEAVIRRRRARLWIGAILWLSVVLVLAFAIGAYAFLRASLPTLDGTITAAGLRGPVSVARDELGVPTVRGSDRGDIAFATGFVHAQERFFQMDLLRRAGSASSRRCSARLCCRSTASGGAPLRRPRRRRPGGVARTRPGRARALRRGVNAGLAGLEARPFEYGVLRTTPRRWSRRTRCSWSGRCTSTCRKSN